jgi:hypothetical protein
MAQIFWDNMGEAMKEDWIEKALYDCFLGAMAPQNQGKYTPQDFLKAKLIEVGQDNYSSWMSKNTDWIPGRIKKYETQFGFSLTAYYNETPDEPTGNETTPTQTSDSWFSRNYLIIIFILIALAGAGYFVYRKMKKK